MEDKFIKIIEELGYPVIKQGSMAEKEEYPDTFFTFWNNSVDDGSHYDNEASTFLWDFDLNVYSIDPEKIEELLIKAKEKLVKEGFIVGGKGHDVISDEKSHIGRGIDVQAIEKI